MRPSFRALAFLPAFLSFVACSSATPPRATAEALDHGVPQACFLRAAPAPTPTPGADAGASSIFPSDAGAPTAVAAPSEPVRCASDAECGAGARCNAALSPPRCVKLYCVPDEGACSAPEQCLEGRQCHAGRCNPCNLCGDRCEVDLATDRDHCGQCGRAAVGEQACVDGEPTCPAEGPDLCGTRCVDLRTDPTNCGACGRVMPSGGRCDGGKPTCEGEQLACGGRCIEVKEDRDNCGKCGRACRAESTCTNGYCVVERSSKAPEKCDAVCARAGLDCGDGRTEWVKRSGATTEYRYEQQPCRNIPGAAPAGFVLDAVTCLCVER